VLAKKAKNVCEVEVDEDSKIAGLKSSQHKNISVESCQTFKDNTAT
jgi:hypothetical protein